MTSRDLWYYYNGQATRYCHLFNKSGKLRHKRRMIAYVRMMTDIEIKAFPTMFVFRYQKTYHYHAGS